MRHERAPIPSLTGLRFFAAAFVMVSHAMPKVMALPAGDPPFWYSFVSESAYIGMTLFFVLSGFVIHYNYDHSIRSRGMAGVYDFFVARIARLYPLYFFCVAFDLLLTYCYGQSSPTTLNVLPYYATMTQSWFYRIVGEHNLIFQFGIMPQVAWSVSTEFFFYACYPAICLALLALPTLRQKMAAAIILVAVVLTAIGIGSNHLARINAIGVTWFGPLADFHDHLWDSFVNWLVYFSPYSRITEFLLGCLTASIFVQMRERRVTRFEHWVGMAAMLGALAAAIFLQTAWIKIAGGRFGDTVWALKACFGFAPFVAIFVFCCARYRNAIVRFLESPRIVLAGEASYSLYLLHLMVIYAFRWESATITSFVVGIGNFLRLILTLLSAIGLSLTTWSIVELPFRRTIRALLSIKRRPIADPLTEASR